MKKLLFLCLALAFLSCKDNALSKVDEGSQDIPLDSYQQAKSQPAAVVEPKVQQPTPNADGKYPDIKFNKDIHDFGTIKAGEKVNYTFSFTNTGDADLIVSDARASCGCTASDYTKEPIKPGKKGTLKVSFDSTGKPGQQQKTVTLTTNTATGNEIVTIKAFVEQEENNNN